MYSENSLDMTKLSFSFDAQPDIQIWIGLLWGVCGILDPHPSVSDSCLYKPT